MCIFYVTFVYPPFCLRRKGLPVKAGSLLSVQHQYQVARIGRGRHFQHGASGQYLAFEGLPGNRVEPLRLVGLAVQVVQLQRLGPGQVGDYGFAIHRLRYRYKAGGLLPAGLGDEQPRNGVALLPDETLHMRMKSAR